MKRALFFLPLTLTAACLPQLEPVEGVLYGQYQCDEDTFEQGDNPHAFGYIEVPYTICGELSTVSYVDNQYTGDIDYLTFQLSSTGPYTVELEWDKELSDFDLFLFIVRSNSNIAEVGSSAATDYPEKVNVELEADIEYTAVIAGYGGPASPWGLTIKSR